jgi:hypothetical protein
MITVVFACGDLAGRTQRGERHDLERASSAIDDGEAPDIEAPLA